MKRFCWTKIIKMIILIPLAVLAFGTVVMFLWNWLIPDIFPGGPQITFLQAIGVIVLSKILFGSFGKGGGCDCSHNGNSQGGYWKQKMQDKFSNLSPEEKEKLKEKFSSKCKTWMGGKDEE